MTLPKALQDINLPIWARYLAQDANGTWWAYEASPNQHQHGWYENEIGRYQQLIQTKQNTAWQETLIQLVL